MTTVPQRKSLRLKDYDYAAPGSYFITFCTKNRNCLFWESADNLNDPAQIVLTPEAHCVEESILKISEIYPGISLDTYCIMHDHIHLLLSIHQQTEPPISISKIVSQLKGAVTKRLGCSIWQREYYDHIIRDEADYAQKYTYIENNPIAFVLKNEW